MPLDKSGSKQAFGKNVAAEMHAGKPQRQAVAIAYSVGRKMAGGGPVSDTLRSLGLDSLAAALDDSQPERQPASPVSAQVAPGIGGKVSYYPALPDPQRLGERGWQASPLEAISAGLDLPFRTAGNLVESRGGAPALSTAAYALPQFLSPGRLTQGASAVGRAAKDVLPSMAGKLLDRSPLAAMALEPAYAVKPRGGNWMHYELPNHHANADETLPPYKISGLDTNLEAIKDNHLTFARAAYQESKSNWIDKQLRRYLQTSWGTDQDPLADMLVRGELPQWGDRPPQHHLNQFNIGDDKDPRDYFTGDTISKLTKNPEGKVVSPTPGGYDHALDLRNAIYDYHGEKLNEGDLKQPAWLDKMKPGDPLYDLKAGPGSFHNMMAPNLQRLFDYFNTLRPEQVQNLGVPEAFRNSEAWHAAQAKRMTEDPVAAGGAELHKEYPDQFKWLKLTSNDALDAEGRMMGHCVGSYCDQVRSGSSIIHSLRDPQGRAHVTIESTPDLTEFLKGKDTVGGDSDAYDEAWSKVLRGAPKIVHDKLNEVAADTGSHAMTMKAFEELYPGEFQKALQRAAPRIEQIKGKQNAAPIADYLPYVQDFVRSGSWGKVGDLDNTGLIDTTEPGLSVYGRHLKLNKELSNLNFSDVLAKANDKHGRYATPDELTNLADEHYPKNSIGVRNTGVKNKFAAGGLVAKIKAAASRTATPTKAQAKSGRYQKGEVTLPGLPAISIENAKGSVRSGKDGDGKAWSVTLQHHYGEFHGKNGADGEKVDVFIGPEPNSTKAFVVHQLDKEGGFDEHKVMVGFKDEAAAKKGYLANYEDGWHGLGPVVELTTAELARRLKRGDFKKPLKLSAGGLIQGDHLHPAALEQLALSLSLPS